MYKRYSLHLVY